MVMVVLFCGHPVGRGKGVSSTLEGFKSKGKEECLERSRGRGADWNSGALGRFNRGTHRLQPPALEPA